MLCHDRDDMIMAKIEKHFNMEVTQVNKCIMHVLAYQVMHLSFFGAPFLCQKQQANFAVDYMVSI